MTTDNKEIYKLIDLELKNKYEKYNNIEGEELTYNIYSKKQQIERYARNLAFWTIEKEKISIKNQDINQTKNNKELNILIMTNNIIENARNNSFNKLKTMFNKEDIIRILQRVKELIKNPNIKLEKIKPVINLSNIRNDMKEYSIKSEELYRVCCDEGYEGLFDPVIWIQNQDKMRKSWEEYKSNMEKKPSFFSKLMLNNSFSKYMSFMYDTYPSGFGNKLEECYNNNEVIDGAEIFYKLKYI